jgi:HK97 family phage prohead protease
MSEIYLYKSGHIGASIKDVDGKRGIVTGYFSAFNNVDSDGDIIRKGAFAKSIQEWGPQSSTPRIKHLMNHNSSQPLGKITMLVEDTKGLAYESQIGTHSLGTDFVKMVESNLITEHSIGFRTMKRNQLQDYEEYIKNPDKGWYELTDIKLYEGSSLTAWGANPNTPLTGMKGATTEDIVQSYINRQKNIEKFCANTTASDETIELLLIELKQLTQVILHLTEQSKNDTHKNDELLIADIRSAFTLFNNSLNH